MGTAGNLGAQVGCSQLWWEFYRLAAFVPSRKSRTGQAVATRRPNSHFRSRDMTHELRYPGIAACAWRHVGKVCEHTVQVYTDNTEGMSGSGCAWGLTPCLGPTPSATEA